MTHKFNNIPAEMRFYKQWVTWRYEEQDAGKKPTKVLYNPLYNGHASVDKPDTWVTYEEAVSAFEADPVGWAGIGFVLTENDPYGFVDLDNTTHEPNHDELFERQQAVFGMFRSYAEYSPSGTGLHIITKGSVERGRKRSAIEIYSNLRFMTMTGNVYRDAPIYEEDMQFKQLWHAMGGAAAIHAREANYQPQSAEDNVILTRMFTAENGQKAREIYEGHFAQHCQSQSEADQALLNIIVFYTKNKEQIIRLFQQSALGNRKKAFRVDYLERSIALAFDRELPPVDTEALLIMLEDARAASGAAPEGPSAAPNIAGADAEPGRLAQPSDAPTLVKPSPPVNADIVIPPGLIGEIAEFIYTQAPSPIPTAALVAAIGLVAGIAGRSYNISGQGLNQYLLFLAPTGTGKEAISSGISKLVHALEINGSPKVRDFIGPGQIRSDAGLTNWLIRQNCCVSILGEFGMKLKDMSERRAPSHLTQIRGELLNMYGKSGWGNIHYPSAYADKEKTTEGIVSPCFSIIGESTQERFYEAVDEQMVYDGLMPRFTMFEYDGKLPTYNEHASLVVPSEQLIQRLGKLVSLSKTITDADKGPIVIQQTDDAKALLNRFKAFCMSFYANAKASELLRGIWSRGHMKALKLAGTVAIGFNMEAPVIDIQTAQWACKLIADECQRLYDNFGDGKVGVGTRQNEDAQHKAMVRVLANWLRDQNPQATKYGLRSDMQFQGCVTQSALVRRLVSDMAFKREYGGNGAGVKEAIKMMLGNDELRQLSTDDVTKRFGSTAICYMVTNPAEMFRNV